jgi:ABC-2 type transport system permease protein
VFDQLQARFARGDLRHALAWVVAFPDDGKAINNVPELGFGRHPPEVSVRSRSALYARKFLGRLEGKISD